MSLFATVTVHSVHGPCVGLCTEVGADGKPSVVTSGGTTYVRDIGGQFVPQG